MPLPRGANEDCKRPTDRPRRGGTLRRTLGGRKWNPWRIRVAHGGSVREHSQHHTPEDTDLPESGRPSSTSGSAIVETHRYLNATPEVLKSWCVPSAPGATPRSHPARALRPQAPEDGFQPRPAVVGQVAGERPRFFQEHAHVPKLRE